MKLVTTNRGKYKETKEIAKSFEIGLTQLKIDIPEIRGTLEMIVKDKAKKAYELVKEPVLCDDSGLFIGSLNGFPGAFSKFTLGKIGNLGIIRLLKGMKRDAEFKCAACFYDGKNFYVEVETSKGKIILEEKGNQGFGFDPIFIPEGHDKTFGEDFKYKMTVSHRKKAFKKLFETLRENFVK
ncbi:MAG: RdgB/HAM1 family non-canonical purine NTP pyrophosphatase [Candidatus Altiarchaeota archaeon]|nr:RdgB/HAM1 family non-canonical purine NTP pyrophosphatase [Candidatus Altiarchaeota archaeon]